MPSACADELVPCHAAESCHLACIVVVGRPVSVPLMRNAWAVPHPCLRHGRRTSPSPALHPWLCHGCIAASWSSFLCTAHAEPLDAHLWLHPRARAAHAALQGCRPSRRPPLLFFFLPPVPVSVHVCRALAVTQSRQAFAAQQCPVPPGICGTAMPSPPSTQARRSQCGQCTWPPSPAARRFSHTQGAPFVQALTHQPHAGADVRERRDM